MANNEMKNNVDSYDITLAMWLYDYGIKGNYEGLEDALYNLGGYDEIGQFVAEKVEEFKDSKWDDMEIGINECILNYIGDNKDKWLNELRGEKYYKVRAVIEVDVLNANVDDAIGEVRDCLLDGFELNLEKGWSKAKALRVFSNDYDGSYEKR